MQGTKVIVIDPEREYKNLSESVDGTYIKLSTRSKDKINPFDVSAVLSYQAYPNNKADPIKEKEVLGLEKLDIEKSNES